MSVRVTEFDLEPTEGTLPQRLITLAHMLTAPPDIPSPFWVFLGVLGSSILAWFYATPASYQVFVFAAAAELATSFYATQRHESLWKHFSVGIWRKFILGFALQCAWAISNKIGGMETFTAMITLTLAANEGRLALRNLKKGKYEGAALVEEAWRRRGIYLGSRSPEPIDKSDTERST
jgi:hypothetical protein